MVPLGRATKFTIQFLPRPDRRKESNVSKLKEDWNKRRGRATVTKSINLEVGINLEGGIFWKKTSTYCNKQGVDGGKNLRNQ